jgi:hypothetical protein
VENADAMASNNEDKPASVPQTRKSATLRPDRIICGRGVEEGMEQYIIIHQKYLMAIKLVERKQNHRMGRLFPLLARNGRIEILYEAYDL